MQFFENFKDEYKDVTGRWLFSMLREEERRHTQQGFYSLLKPFFYGRAMLNGAFKKSSYAMPRPDFLQVQRAAQAEKRLRMNDYLNHVLEFFPDRLASDKWKQNCRIEGFDHWQSARRERRPVIMPLCHFGPYYLLRYWLRAWGIPAAGFIDVKTVKPWPLQRWKDGLALFPEIPHKFYSDQMRLMNEFLAAENTLLLPIDVPVQKQVSVPFCEGWTFQMAAGAVRLAIHHDAELIPCTMVDEGRWHFSIKFGRPVPRELLSTKDEWVPAAKSLLDEMIPIFKAHPEQCRPDLIRCLKQNI